MATITLTIDVPAVAGVATTVKSPTGTSFTIDAGTALDIPLELYDQFDRRMAGAVFTPAAVNNPSVHVASIADGINVAVDADAGVNGITGLQLDIEGMVS